MFTRKRTFEIPVPTSGAQVAKEIELPSDIETLFGFAISSDRRDLAWARASLGLTIANQELILEGEDATEYMFGIEHPSRFFAFGEMPVSKTDRRMRVRVQDTDVPGRPFSPYVIKVILTYRTSK